MTLSHARLAGGWDACLVEGLDFGLAEVDAASELADDDEVGAPAGPGLKG
ncbi:unnamed protein product, partial [Clonostachys rhizophaga]